MKKKKRIVHVIDNLVRGGAETMFIDMLSELVTEYELILVTLNEKLEFDRKEIICAEHISLHYYSIKDLPSTVMQLRKIIKRLQPDLVRCQLFFSTIIGRLACPKEIPFFFSVHATMNEDPIAFYKRYYLYLLEKLTYRPRQNMIGVTQAVIDSFIKVHSKHGKVFLLHNFVRNQFFIDTYQPQYQPGKTLRLVAVSNLRLIKNIPYLIETMKQLQHENVTLDIYGDGPLRSDIEKMIRDYDLSNVVLKGKRPDIHNILPQYDLYISPSTVEGFGIAVAEAMSVGLPVAISDIPVYKEIAGKQGFYINKDQPESLVNTIHQIIIGKADLEQISRANKEYSQKIFSKQGYLSRLIKIYQT